MNDLAKRARMARETAFRCWKLATEALDNSDIEKLDLDLVLRIEQLSVLAQSLAMYLDDVAGRDEEGKA